MKRKNRNMALALILALALLLPLGLAEAGLAGGEEIDLLAGEDAPEEMPGEAGVLGPVEAAPTPAPEAAPDEKGRGIPWLTSYNYPKGKVNFENEIWAMLTGKWGLKDFQAAGLMSSLQAESGFCPYNVEGRGGSDDRGKYEYRVDDSVGFGLGQWTSAGRKAALLRHAERHGSAELVWDFDIQMGFMGGEIDMRALKATRSLYEAAEWAVLAYERPDQRHENSWPGTRYERGLALYRAHTGRDYEEPPLRYSLRDADGEAVGPGGLALPSPGAPGRLAVRSSYYWRLEIADEAPEGWLRVEAPSFYRPEALEPCACGYACEGEKPLTLTAAQWPPLGRTYEATLRLEFWRGGHTVVELPVRATGTPRDLAALPGLPAAAIAVGAALLASGRLVPGA